MENRYIPGYEGLYLVDKMGNIYSIISEKYLASVKTCYGYMQVTLCKHGETKSQRVHRAVLEAFSGVDPKRPYVNHLNGDKTDNRLENLAWVTSKENTYHAVKNGLLTSDHLKRYSKNNRIPVYAKSKEGDHLLFFPSILAASKDPYYDFRSSSIRRCLKLSRKSHRNYTWHVWR